MSATTASKVLTDRIDRIEISATMAVTAEAAKLKAEGAKLVNFGAGEPHFDTPRHIKDAAIAAIESNFTRYTNVAGIPELRKAIVDRHACDFGSDYSAEEAIFTTGGKLALFNAVQVLVEHGDEVILPVPYWVSFKDIVEYAGGKLVTSRRRRRRISGSPPTRSRRRSRRAPRPSSSIRLRIPRALSSRLPISNASSSWPMLAASTCFLMNATSICSTTARQSPEARSRLPRST